MDVGDAVRVSGGLGFGEQGGALGVGGHHGFEHAEAVARRFLRYGADAGPLVDLDRARVDGNVALDQVEQRGLAGAVLAHEPRLGPVGQHQRGALEQGPPLDAVGEVGDGEHDNNRNAA